MNLPTRPLFTVADVRVSTVDKLTADGEVPVRLCNYTDVYKNGVVNPNLELMEATATPEEIRRFRLGVGDTVFTKDSETADDIGVPAFVDGSADDFVCGYHLAIARPVPDVIHPKYLYWWLSSADAARLWEIRASGVTRVGLRQSDITHFPVPMPPSIEHQRAVAGFLDRETAQIDALIEAQRQLVVALNERKRAVVTSAVFADGLATSVWPVRHVIRSIDQGWSPQVDSYPVDNPLTEWAILKVGCVNGGTFRPEENKAFPADLAPRPDLAVRAGDVLVSRGNTRELVASAAVVREDYPALMLSDLLYRLRVDSERMDPSFLSMALGSQPLRDQIELRAKGTSHSMLKLSQADVKELRVPQLSLARQQEIQLQVSHATSAIEAMVGAAAHAMALMQERRSALISAAVTGRFDPRTSKKIVPGKVLEFA